MSNPENLRSVAGASLRSSLYGYGPFLVFVLVVAVSAVVEALIDLELFGRAANGSPELNTVPVLEIVIGAWNLAVTYLGPIVIAVAFLLHGIRHRAPVNPMMLGGILVCFAGGFSLVGLWATIDGMEHLGTGFADGPAHATIRIIVNLMLFGTVAFLMLPRRN